jgi:hypothetical protein
MAGRRQDIRSWVDLALVMQQVEGRLIEQLIRLLSYSMKGFLVAPQWTGRVLSLTALDSASTTVDLLST